MTDPTHPTGPTGYRPDVRPHVPHVDPAADPRLHFIADGVAACGVTVTVPGRCGTHDPAEADCPDCVAALRHVGAGLPTDEDAAAVTPEALAAVDDVPALPAPRGWDWIEGGGRVVHPQPPKDWARVAAAAAAAAAAAVVHSLDGHLIDMTEHVDAYADDNRLRRWQCRHCGLGRVMGPYAAVTAREEGADCADHEAHCDRNPNRDPGAITEETTHA